MSASDSVSPLSVALQAAVPAAGVSPAADPAATPPPSTGPPAAVPTNPANPGTPGQPVVPAMWAPLFAEDDAVANGRARTDEAGIDVVDPVAGAALRFLAALISARTVVQVGTGAGISGLWLLRGMRPDGVLTSIDPDAESQRLARAAFRADGVPHARTRLIAGSAPAVLPRLADAGYDLVHLDCPARELPECVAEALRLLRPKGVLVLTRALSESESMEQIRDTLRDDPRLTLLLVPVGMGILAAALPPAPAADGGPEASDSEHKGT
ncbi:MAG: O-methyltransferase [Frankiaceae bacterium]